MTLDDAKILIGDDSILARKQLKDIISSLGTPNFIEAKDGQDAIDKYKEFKPDLAFLDIVMPKKDGNDAINFGDNIPIDDIYEKNGRVYLAPPEAL